MEQCTNTEELQHWGIKGMKWGVRRYQNKDGSLTPAGKKRADKMKEEYTALTGKRLIRKPTPKPASSQNGETTNQKKRIRDMSDEEIRNKINRLENEKRLAGLEADTASGGQKFISAVGKQVVAPAAIDAGKRLLTDLIMKVGKEKLGLNDNKSEAADEILKELRKENETLSLKRKIHENKKTLERYDQEEKATKQAKKQAKKDEKQAKQAEKQAKKDSAAREKAAKENAELIDKYKKMYDEVDKELSQNVQRGEEVVNQYGQLLIPPPDYKRKD